MTRTLTLRTADWRSGMPAGLAAMARELPVADNPGDVLTAMYDAVRAVTGDGDPYQLGKDLANEWVDAWWETHRLPLHDVAGRLALAVAGNAIDAGVDADSSVLLTHFERAQATPLARDDRSQALRWLDDHPGAAIVYLLDNCGEAVLDREVMRSLAARGFPVTAVVKGAPILNDITTREATRIGLAEVAQVVPNGSNACGIQPGRTSSEVLDRIRSADLVIAKGLAHLETLSHRPRPGPTLFLYQAKCPPSARLLGVREHDGVAWWRNAGEKA
jgi:uncharacterized protein with ATP-grasp and redox domains